MCARSCVCVCGCFTCKFAAMKGRPKQSCGRRVIWSRFGREGLRQLQEREVRENESQAQLRVGSFSRIPTMLSCSGVLARSQDKGCSQFVVRINWVSNSFKEKSTAGHAGKRTAPWVADSVKQRSGGFFFSCCFLGRHPSVAGHWIFDLL